MVEGEVGVAGATPGPKVVQPFCLSRVGGVKGKAEAEMDVTEDLRCDLEAPTSANRDGDRAQQAAESVMGARVLHRL